MRYAIGLVGLALLTGCQVPADATTSELALQSDPAPEPTAEAPASEPPCDFDYLTLNGAERFQFQGAYRIVWHAGTNYWLMLSLFENGHAAYAINQGAGYIEDGRGSLTDTWTRIAGCKVQYRLANGTLRFTLQNPVVDGGGWLTSIDAIDHASGNTTRISGLVLHMDVTACSGVF